ncbi:hypothetical protein GGF46_003761 [Coemansia sp. RSA 552]|nr:hypothetical protein GGF46_003761 [Coemansia sp. RSA 552]
MSRSQSSSASGPGRSGQRQHRTSSSSGSSPDPSAGMRDEREDSEDPGPRRPGPKSQSNENNTDESDRETRDSDRTGPFSSRSRKQRRAQGSAAVAAAAAGQDADGEGGDRSSRGNGGGINGGSTMHIPCKFYKHGNCTAGSNCYFSHDINLFVEKSVCKYYVKGNCRYGNKCALLHTGSNDGSGPRSQKAGGGGGNGGGRGAQNHRAGGIKGGGLRSGLSSANASKKDRKGGAHESPQNNDAAGRASGNSGVTPPSSASHGQGTRTQSTASPHSGSNSGSTSGDSSGKPANAWATGSIASALRKERAPRSSHQGAVASSLKERKRHAGPGLDSGSRRGPVDINGDAPEYLMAGDHAGSLSPQRLYFGDFKTSRVSMEQGGGAASQPIPKAPPPSFNRAVGDGALQHGGLSMQDSMRIDNLTLSHGAAHQSFAGSPFMTSSIPLLDHFRDITSGTSPHAQSFSRSPMTGGGGTAGLPLGRHAFTAADTGTPNQDAVDADISGASSLHPGYPGHLQASHMDMSPAGHPISSAQSIPHASDLFGRSFRSSSMMNEPLSPLSSFAVASNDLADANAQATLRSRQLGNHASAGGVEPGSGRLRSNSHAFSPTMAGFSSGIDTGNGLGGDAAGSARIPARGPGSLLADEGNPAAYSLNDVRSMPHDPMLDTGSGVWDSPAAAYSSGGAEFGSRFPFGGHPLGASHDRAPPGAVRGGIAASLGRQNYQQGPVQPHWAQAAKSPFQTGGHPSPFAAAVSSSFGDGPYSAMSQFSLMSPFGEATSAGAIGQRPQKAQGSSAIGGMPRGYPNSGGSGLNMLGMDGGRAPTSGNGSSAGSDHLDDLFELEQDVPAQTRANSHNTLAPNPQFISMEGFSHKLSGLSLSRNEPSSAPSESASRSIASISAIARPAA